MKKPILITGATGTTGTFTVKRLLELKKPVRAMVRKLDDRSAALSKLGAEIVVGDFLDFNSVSAALKGVSTAYFVYPVSPGLITATAYFAQAALEEDIELIVNVSQRTAKRDVPSHSAQDHWIAERLLDRSSVPVTHLQPTLFMDWISYFAQEIKENSRLISPFGDARVGNISSEDIAKVGAAILASPEGHAGKTYRIYGPNELSQIEVANIISEVLQRKIIYTPVDPADFVEIVRGSSSPFNTPFITQHIEAIGHMFQSGEFGGMNNNVEELSGVKPFSVADFVSRNIDLFK